VGDGLCTGTVRNERGGLIMAFHLFRPRLSAATGWRPLRWLAGLGMITDCP